MAYGYLIDPTRQFLDLNGKPIVGGWVEVFLHNTTTKYITFSDFSLTPNPFKIPIDIKGMTQANVIAATINAYDVYIYNSIGTLFASALNITIGGEGGGVVSVELPLKIVGDKVTNGGKDLSVTGENAWAEGAETTASGENSHAEGGGTTASGEHSHSEGFMTTASSGYSHAEGAGTKATNTASHAEGQDTTASGQASHAEGRGSEASGNYSHASGRGTRATNEGSHAVGRWNDDGDALFVVGDGTNNNQRHDAFKVDRNGDTWVSINGVLTKVTNLSGDQFVLVRSNMTTDFTNAEYQDCVDAVTAEKAVCVQFVMTGTTIQAQLTMITGGGTLVFEFTAENNHYRWEVAATSNAHSIELIGNIFGVPIFDTLQEAITNEYTLKSGDIFETNGFHTSGDGGAARYKVSSTGTANGMDIIQLSTGKFAVLQFDEWICPEQIGYKQDWNRVDVVPYIEHIISIGCQHIRLLSPYDGIGYWWKTKLTIGTMNVLGNNRGIRGFKLIGQGDWGAGNPSRYTYIRFVPSDASVTEMIDLKMRDVEIRDIDFEVYANDYQKLVDGIICTGYNSDENRFWEISNLRFNSFRNGIWLKGGIKWTISIKNCLFNYCVNGIQVYESSCMQMYFEELQFINCDTYGMYFNGNVLSAEFHCCNFGSLNTAVKMKVNADAYKYQNVLFTGCNFELDVNQDNMPAVYLDFYDPDHSDVRQNVTIENCHFTLAKSSMPVQPSGNRYIRLGTKTRLTLINNQILGTGESDFHPDFVTYPKKLWNENYLPTDGCIAEVGDNYAFDFPDELAPYTYRKFEAKCLTATGRRNPNQNGWSDCNTWIPEFNGQVKVCGVSTYDSPATQNLPITNTFGYLWVIGVIDGANPRLLQRYEAHNGNIYTRLGRGSGGVWTWDAWKTITAT